MERKLKISNVNIRVISPLSSHNSRQSRSIYRERYRRAIASKHQVVVALTLFSGWINIPPGQPARRSFLRSRIILGHCEARRAAYRKFARFSRFLLNVWFAPLTYAHASGKCTMHINMVACVHWQPARNKRFSYRNLHDRASLMHLQEE